MNRVRSRERPFVPSLARPRRGRAVSFVERDRRDVGHVRASAARRPLRVAI